MAYVNKEFSDFKVGDGASITRTVTETDVVLFAGISGDFNPLHMNEEFAKTTRFQGRIAHGAFVASLIGAAGAPFFGSNSVYLGHTQRFKAPVKIGDTITAAVEVIELFPEKKRIKIRTYCTNQKGVIVMDGEADIMIL